MMSCAQLHARHAAVQELDSTSWCFAYCSIVIQREMVQRGTALSAAKLDLVWMI
jgi:hypothetical protein